MKKDRDKRLIKNCRPISLLNIESKLIWNLLANRLQDIMTNLVSENQSSYINSRFISEGGRVILDTLEITNLLQIDGLLMTIDIKKAFDSVNHFFLISVLKRSVFGDYLIKWIKTLLKNQESCVLKRRKNNPLL